MWISESGLLDYVGVYGFDVLGDRLVGCCGCLFELFEAASFFYVV